MHAVPLTAKSNFQCMLALHHELYFGIFGNATTHAIKSALLEAIAKRMCIHVLENQFQASGFWLNSIKLL